MTNRKCHCIDDRVHAVTTIAQYVDDLLDSAGSPLPAPVPTDITCYTHGMTAEQILMHAALAGVPINFKSTAVAVHILATPDDATMTIQIVLFSSDLSARAMMLYRSYNEGRLALDDIQNLAR